MQNNATAYPELLDFDAEGDANVKTVLGTEERSGEGRTSAVHSQFDDGSMSPVTCKFSVLSIGH
jgi:hypothetical protein